MHTTVRIEINGHEHEVHDHNVSGREIKARGHREHALLFRLDESGGRHLVGDDDVLQLQSGARFVTASQHVHKSITIEVDERCYETQHDRLTGAEIKALAKRPAGNVLYRLDGQQRIRIGDDESVELHEHERFVTFPPHGHAS